jgi:mannose-6-phosphate isomerase-like protein (cupin superfamily)
VLVLIDDVPVERQDASTGWRISEFRLPLRGPGFCVFHGRFRPGSRHSVHRHLACDELCVYLSGRGLVGTGDDRYAVSAGDARLIPTGVPHYFHNAGTEGVAEVLGLYLGAESVAATGYELIGEVGVRDLERSERGGGAVEYPWTRRGAGRLVDAPGWKRAECRVLVSSDAASCWSALVAPGGGYAGEQEREAVFLVFKGSCDADGAIARAGHIWHVPAGAHVSVRNMSETDALELYGFAFDAR